MTDLIDIVNNLTPETYHNLKDKIELNHKKSLEFLNFENRVCNKIEKIIQKLM
jgi:uncharacterized protein YeaC (DUF1315 family)